MPQDVFHIYSSYRTNHNKRKAANGIPDLVQHSTGFRGPQNNEGKPEAAA